MKTIYTYVFLKILFKIFKKENMILNICENEKGGEKIFTIDVNGLTITRYNKNSVQQIIFLN